MTPTVIDVITSRDVVHENGDAELGVVLTPLSATLEKLLPWTVVTIGTTAAALALLGTAVMIVPSHLPWLTVPMST